MKKVNEVMARFWIWVLGCFYGTSIRTRERFGAVIAWILWWAIPKRRHVALTNLRLCFPDWTEEKRVRIAKQNYRNMGRAALDHAVLWKGTKEELQAMVKFEGLDLVTDTDNRPLIVVSPHFLGLDAAGITFNTYVRGVSLYQTQSNKAWDKAELDGRLRFCNPILIAKTGHFDLRPVIRAMRDGQRRSAAFCEKAAQTISELKSAGVTPEMLAEYAKTPGACGDIQL